MNKIIFTEEFCQPENLHPFTLTRQIQDIRIGILTIREKWELMLGLISYDKKEDDYKDLDRSVNIDEVIGDDVCFMIHGNVLPTSKLVKAILRLKEGEFIATPGGNSVAFCITKNEIADKYKIKVGHAVTYREEIKTIQFPWDIFHLNDWAIRQDFELLTSKRKSQPISKTNKVIKPSQLFIEKGAKVEHCIINASTGPVYIGKDAEVMEGCVIRGPFSLGEKACLKMGTKVYGATTVGPQSVVGGEIKNSVLFGYSNKAHEGYLGDSVIGEWCNMGAGTTNSNLKNNASDVKVWTPKGELNAGPKCGVMMGDYSRTAVNTAINTGTVIGVSCNVFGSGLTPKYIPNFSWGSEGVKRYEFEKALLDIEDWKKLKGQIISDDEKSILKYIFEKF
ncbi:MAG: glucose-1-phosphate thymidylyltransferase [Chitinophagaceae bacterium]|nr:glucose-1-phosphate thymidylyltransferase [Chitinophagaceae bacterium]MBL0306268.1 glucose-1-phosphate thymidylyltransferase [Chitinophagaceae bacterium]HQV61522.1 putative sugar nucleotidyl transferase [Chitinophagaceae bacterium]HQV84276.1 putative sugar nucleotidyl transferase [Chitinophagaceae bacterium]HQX73730.1 putative sugar nucleotidyl transferase [Chitinophagaceae bacterium]